MIHCLESSDNKETAHKKIRDAIPSPIDETKLENLVIPYGFALLQEITFNLIVYIGADVNSQVLRNHIFTEYKQILLSLVHSYMLYDQAVGLTKQGQPITEAMLENYMDVRRRKMNQKMTVLADCISVEEPIPTDLLEFIDIMGHIYELRGTAYRSVVQKDRNNNLYNYWHMFKKGNEDPTLDSVTMKT
jgi:hypothetical protein